MSLIDPLCSNPPPRRRGRPALAKTKVVRDERALGLHHFAFLRSVILGLDLRDSFDRYLAWSEPLSDLRIAQARFDHLLSEVLNSGDHINAALPDEQKITPLLQLLRPLLKESTIQTTPAPSPAVQIPTLDEWVLQESIDLDFFSEAELIAEYQGAFGLDQPQDGGEPPDTASDLVHGIFSSFSAENRPHERHQNAAINSPEGAGLGDSVKRRISALNRLESHLAALPSPADQLGLWFAPGVSARLASLGLLSLQDLVHYVNVRGHRWYAHARGIGQKKAQQILAWLSQQSATWDIALSSAVVLPQQYQAIERRNLLGAGTHLVLPPVFGMVPLERLVLPFDLDGRRGVFRSQQPNTLDANTDLEAINAWLAQHQERAATVRSYRKEAERFLLFCSHVLRKSLSSATAPDCLQYRAFLMQVPQDWIHPMPVRRDDAMWRPFRGQPEPSSQKQALVILQAMFEGLRNANYVVANPFQTVIKGFNLPSSKVDLDRSLSQAEWRFITDQAQRMPDTAESRRLRLLLDLLVSTGLRLDELANAERNDLKLVNVDGEKTQAWVLDVVGKRRKRRAVPIPSNLPARIDAHAADAIAAHFLLLSAQTKANASDTVERSDSYLGGSPTESTETRGAPLIYALNMSVAQWGDGLGKPILELPDLGPLPARLSSSGIYRTLKRFFQRCSLAALSAGLEPAHLQSASTHWLRHSFGREAAVSGVPIEIISQAMGHASLTTTSIYLTQERSRMIKELRKMHTSIGATDPPAN